MTANSERIARDLLVGGHYQLDHVLGQGGMGIVWAARDLRLGRLVAVKFLGPAAMNRPLERERFTREARIASRIRSPHVAQIIADGATSDGVPFLVMELLDGESLAAHLAHVGRCTIASAGVVLEQVCRALSSAHAVGLVHRDVKPANIFLTPQSGGDVFVRLLDFGIAKELQLGPSGLTKAGELLGTADYMSPEQLRSPDAVSCATDIWSLGVVLYEMLTGARPFSEDTFPALALRVTEGRYEPPTQLCRDLPHAVDDIIARALATQPNRRYATVSELGAAFLKIVRAHTSDSVIRPEVMRALHGHLDTLPASEPGEHVRGQTTTSQAAWLTKERVFGVLFVVLCALVVLLSWLASERTNAVPDAPSAVLPSLPPAAAAPLEPAPANAVPTQLPELDIETSTNAISEGRAAPAVAPAAIKTPRERRAERRHPRAAQHAQDDAPVDQREPAAVAPSQPAAATPAPRESNYGF